MSSESLAAFRRHAGDELGALADQHMKHDLNKHDRDALRSAAGKFGTHTTIGSLVGLGLGVFLAYRVRMGRRAMFDALRATEKPTHIKFADGREKALPDINPYLRPSPWADATAYFLFAAGGLFIGGETGVLTGTWSAKRQLDRDPDSQRRIQTAFNKFRADVLRKQADRLDAMTGGGSILDSARGMNRL